MGSIFYYPRFGAVIIDADGFAVPLPSVSLNVYNVTKAASLGTLTSDADAFIAEGYYSTPDASDRDIIEISSGTYAGTCRFMLRDNLDDAYTSNSVITYVAQSLAAPVNAKFVEVYLTDADHPDTEPINLGIFPTGTTPKIPLQTAIPKNYTISFIAIAENGVRSDQDLSTAESVNVAVPAIVSAQRTLFDHFTDSTTSGTAVEILRLNRIDANTLGVNGDKIIAEYSGIFAANAHQKELILEFAGTEIFDSTDYAVLIGSGSHYQLKTTIIRVNKTTVRCSTALSVSLAADMPFVGYVQITGLALTSTNYDLKLSAQTAGAAGDLTDRMAYGLYIPRATVTAGALLFGGEEVLFSGDPVTFNP